MPNIKSAKKRVLVNEKKNAQNRMTKTGVKNVVKKAKVSEVKNATDKVKFESEAFAAIDKAASKNVIHKNTANRRKASVAKALNKKTETK